MVDNAWTLGKGWGVIPYSGGRGMLTSLRDSFFRTESVNILVLKQRIHFNPIDSYVEKLLDKLSVREAQQLLRHKANELNELL